MASNGNGVCCICSKAVYATELMVVDEREYHKGCFRCNVCKRPITITSYNSYNGEIYCKAHKPSIDKNPEPLRHGYDCATMPASLKHARNQTAPPLVFNKNLQKVYEGDIKSPMSENMYSLKNIFEKNDLSQSAPTTPQSPTFSSSPTTLERIEILKKEIQQNNNSSSEILYTRASLSKTSSLRLKKKNPLNQDGSTHVEKMEKINKLLDEIDENWNEFEKTNAEYMNKHHSRNSSFSSMKEAKNSELTKSDSFKDCIIKEENEDESRKENENNEIEQDLTDEDINKCEKEMDDTLRNIDSYISNYYERKNETVSTDGSIESFLEEYSIDSSIKPMTKEKENSNIIGGINNIFKKNSEKLNSNTFTGNVSTKSNILWIRASTDYKYDKLAVASKKQNHYKKYLTSTTLQDYLNIAFETKIPDTRSLQDVCKCIEQYSSEIKHGCETSTQLNNNRPLIESVASPLKFLIDSLNSLYIKLRGVINTIKLTKFINLLASIEDILIKEGFQHIVEVQTQEEYSNLLINACEIITNYSQIMLFKYKQFKRKVNVFLRDTFRLEITTISDDVVFSYAECTLDRVNADAKLYRNAFVDQEHRNYVGNQQCINGPFIISLRKLKKIQSSDTKSEDNAAYQAIVRIKDTPEIIVLIPSVTARSQAKLRSSSSWKSVLQAIHPEINITAVCKVKEKDKVFQKRLMDLDEFQCVSKYKFGILYAKDGQTTEEQMFNNENGSPAFKEFLDILGDTVELKGYTGYAAGLDVQYGNTGDTTVVTKWRDYDVTFHVSTMLPYDKDDPQQIQRKRHIGNDIVCFIFLDGSEAKFDPGTILSQFLHIFIVVQPLQPEESLGIGYRVTIVSKTDVPIFGPPLPPSGIFHNTSALRHFLLAKGINGENAAYLAPKFSKPQLRTRGALIEDLVKDYYEPSTINSSVSLSNMASAGGISQSPTNNTIRSLDSDNNAKIEKRSTFNTTSMTPTVTIIEEDGENNENNLHLKKTLSTSNINDDNDDGCDPKLERYDSSESLKQCQKIYRSQTSVSSDNADKKKSLSSLFTSISNLGKGKPHGSIPPPAK
ncbi:hypothetical protein BCR32DRAFT_283391 [Anaeromyces robustus]|uniref:Rap-GAP domain-containing protein n=1 Tax=Anaeromyces robustus TaxID=1754192 RepID=A0A1Y1WUJ8_9FUNG|nr:hypothetical protein BCR32DRAFT_283391 [Anaeromyces robustus]|eukprot:ORX77229.1 hypothetical protein BCR32DRAFT_283391 [Anaeromyces robustus]